MNVTDIILHRWLSIPEYLHKMGTANALKHRYMAYCSDMYSIRKLKQPLKQKVPF